MIRKEKNLMDKKQKKSFFEMLSSRSIINRIDHFLDIADSAVEIYKSYVDLKVEELSLEKMKARSAINHNKQLREMAKRLVSVHINRMEDQEKRSKDLIELNNILKPLEPLKEKEKKAKSPKRKKPKKK